MPIDPLPLRGRNALVTGVSRRVGIGDAIVRRLADLDANVAAHGYAPYDAQQPWGADQEALGALAEAVRAHGGRMVHLSGDFADPATPSLAVQQARAALDHIDILVVNHAYSTMGTLEAITAAQIDAHLAVNVRASLLLVQAFVTQHDDARPDGRVVLLTSGQHRHPMPDELAYVASKGALHQLTGSLSAHLARRGITVNTVNPGATDTGYAPPELHVAVASANPHGRWGTPDDAARLIAWLCTDDARWVTGQVIDSTGGGL